MTVVSARVFSLNLLVTLLPWCNKLDITTVLVFNSSYPELCSLLQSKAHKHIVSLALPAKHTPPHSNLRINQLSLATPAQVPSSFPSLLQRWNVLLDRYLLKARNGKQTILLNGELSTFVRVKFIFNVPEFRIVVPSWFELCMVGITSEDRVIHLQCYSPRPKTKQHAPWPIIQDTNKTVWQNPQTHHHIISTWALSPYVWLDCMSDQCSN